MIFKKTNKHKASALLAVVLIFSLVGVMLSVSIAKISHAGINSTSSNKTTIQAQQYAQSEAELLRSVSYKSLSAQGKTAIGKSGFKKEVLVGAESNYNDTVKQKQVTIRIYHDQESLPRANITLTRYNTEPAATVSSKVFSIPQNGSVSYTLPSSVKHLSVYTVTDFTPHLDSNTTNRLIINGIGTLDMYIYSDRHGSKGYGYDYPSSASACGDYNVNLPSGSQITLSTSLINPFSPGHTSYCVYHTIVFLVMS